jgi:DNA-binding winged helix-turn-helix (wHTH) protein
MSEANVRLSLRFGAFELDLAAGRLLRHGRAVHLTPKALALLDLLASRSGELVTKRELFASLWPGTVVTDFALSRCIRELRSALADDARRPQFLETVHRRGFRFVAEVARSQAGGGAQSLFVGRDRELRAARDWLERRSAGAPKLLRISGEPGVGKTRLAREIAEHAARAGASVLWSATPGDEGAPPYAVWRQILEGDPAARAPAARSTRAGSQWEIEPLAGRQRAFELVERRLAALTAQRPALLVLDDLHGADGDSLHLLDHLVHDVENPRLAIVCTLRDVGAPANAALQRALGVDPTPAHASLALRGLAPEAVAALLAARVGSERARTFAALAHDKSGGNPLYLGELVASVPHDPQAAAMAPGVPETLRQLIAQRLERVSALCADVLAATAVVGSSSALALIADVTELPAATLAAGVEEAVAQRLLARESGALRVRFSHGVVREVVYERTTPGLRARLHRRVARALEQGAGGDGAASASLLAHHFGRAVIGGETARAIHYALRAGGQALRSYAFEEAAGHFENALDAFEAEDPLDSVRAARAAMAAARAQALCARGERALALASRAVELARRSGSARMLREAAVVFCELQPSYGRDPRAVALLDAALRRSGDRDPALRSRLISLRGMMAFVDADPATHRSASRRALAAARRSGDSGALLEALRVRSLALNQPATQAAWRKCYAERIALAAAAGNEIHGFEARQHRLEHHQQLGEMACVANDIEEMEQIARRVRSPSMAASLLRIRANLAIARGPIAEARELAERALAAGERVDAQESWAIAQLQIGSVTGFEDLFGDVAANVHRGTHTHPQISLFRTSEIFLLAQSGARAEAEARLRALARDGFAGLSQDVSYPLSLSNLALSAALLRCCDAAEALIDRLQPYAGRTLTLLSVYSAGCASRFLGVLSALLGRWDEAAAHFEVALAVDTATGARVWAAHDALEYARFLAARGGATNGARACQLGREALAASQALGLALVARGARELLATLGVERTEAELQRGPRAAAQSPRGPS